MRIKRIIWSDDRVDHIARHGITPEEFEDVCFGRSLVLRGKSQGPNPVYQVVGQTSGGRYVICFVIHFPDGNGYPITARPMTEMEKQRYRKWRQP